MRTAKSITDIVTSGLCIGCGLCEALGGGKVSMTMTQQGSLRPTSLDQLETAEEELLLAACPGCVVTPRQSGKGKQDPIWGEFRSMNYAWASNHEIRHRSATGGVLTALGCHLLASGEISFVLQTRTDPTAPMRSIWTISETVEDIVESAGSRYGPTAPLAGLADALAREEPFAIIAKPCDLNALHNLSHHDERVNRYCRFRLAMVCGGQSRLKKSQSLLDEFGVREDDLTLFRYRGYGNPGKTVVETKDGDRFEKTYLELWEDESGWELETRCKLCPDALGEASDIAAADVWPGGSPSGEDDGFNGIISRSDAGEKLAGAAIAAGDLILGDAITPTMFNDFQPHQMRKKIALKARYQGMIDAGTIIPDAEQMRLEELSKHLNDETFEHERNGAFERTCSGRFSEEHP